MTKSLMVRQKPTPVKPRPPRRFAVKQTTLLAAVENSYGNIAEIARRVGVSPTAIRRCLKRPGWEAVQQAFEDESLRLVGEARDAVLDNIRQPLDFATKERASEFVLTRLDPAFKDVKTIKVEGGENPIRVAHAHLVNIIDDLPLTLEAKKAALAQLRAGEKPAEILSVSDNKAKGVGGGVE